MCRWGDECLFVRTFFHWKLIMSLYCTIYSRFKLFGTVDFFVCLIIVRHFDFSRHSFCTNPNDKKNILQYLIILKVCSR